MYAIRSYYGVPDTTFENYAGDPISGIYYIYLIAYNEGFGPYEGIEFQVPEGLSFRRKRIVTIAIFIADLTVWTMNYHFRLLILSNLLCNLGSLTLRFRCFGNFRISSSFNSPRITSYNVCYTKLLRVLAAALGRLHRCRAVGVLQDHVHTLVHHGVSRVGLFTRIEPAVDPVV